MLLFWYLPNFKWLLKIHFLTYDLPKLIEVQLLRPFCPTDLNCNVTSRLIYDVQVKACLSFQQNRHSDHFHLLDTYLYFDFLSSSTSTFQSFPMGLLLVTFKANPVSALDNFLSHLVHRY